MGRENRRETEGWRPKERVRVRQKFTESYRFSFTPAWTEIARVQLSSRILSFYKRNIRPDASRDEHLSRAAHRFDVSFRRWRRFSGGRKESFDFFISRN